MEGDDLGQIAKIGAEVTREREAALQPKPYPPPIPDAAVLPQATVVSSGIIINDIYLMKILGALGAGMESALVRGGIRVHSFEGGRFFSARAIVAGTSSGLFGAGLVHRLVLVRAASGLDLASMPPGTSFGGEHPPVLDFSGTQLMRPALEARFEQDASNLSAFCTRYGNQPTLAKALGLDLQCAMVRRASWTSGRMPINSGPLGSVDETLPLEVLVDCGMNAILAVRHIGEATSAAAPVRTFAAPPEDQEPDDGE